jgi:RNA 3'-terminal phosphate cyclase (ATP)
MIHLDGSTGEGGGQILRSALALSMITGQAFRIDRIRAGRKKPGLMRQHLTCVQACARICNASTEGASLRSQSLTFEPQEIVTGDYSFDVGSAGSTSLVLQAILPALLHASWVSGASVVRVRGGTHNPMAPTTTFLQRVFVPQLKAMGFNVRLTVERHGFFPAGGGEVVLTIDEYETLQPLSLLNIEGDRKITAQAIVAGVPASVAQRELFTVGKQFGLIAQHVRPLEACQSATDLETFHRLFATGTALEVASLHEREGPGNALSIFVSHGSMTEVFTGLGEQGVAAEVVAKRACNEAQDYLASNAVVGTHLADQLLLPMALVAVATGKASQFSTYSLTPHTTTNAQVIETFLPVRIGFERDSDSKCVVIAVGLK